MTESLAKERPAGTLERIFVAVDATSRADHVVNTALAIARANGASVRVFRAIAVPPEFPPAASTGMVDDPLPAHMRAEASAELKKLIANANEVRCDIEVGESHNDWSAIVDGARRYDADLIVLGGHRHGLMERVLGTTASKVVEHAVQDVLIVRRPDTRARKA